MSEFLRITGTQITSNDYIGWRVMGVFFWRAIPVTQNCVTFWLCCAVFCKKIPRYLLSKHNKYSTQQCKRPTITLRKYLTTLERIRELLPLGLFIYSHITAVESSIGSRCCEGNTHRSVACWDRSVCRSLYVMLTQSDYLLSLLASQMTDSDLSSCRFFLVSDIWWLFVLFFSPNTAFFFFFWCLDINIHCFKNVLFSLWPKHH